MEQFFQKEEKIPVKNAEKRVSLEKRITFVGRRLEEFFRKN